MKLLALLCLIVAPSVLIAQPSAGMADGPQGLTGIELDVYEAAEDYLLAFYDVEPERLERSLHPDVQKVGFWRNEAGSYAYTTMTYEEAVELAGEFNAAGRIPADAPRKVEVLVAHDMTAMAKVTAVWGIDYLQLGNFDGVWKIINVIWQSAPTDGGN